MNRPSPNQSQELTHLTSAEICLANANNAVHAVVQSSQSALAESLRTISALRQEKEALQKAFDAKVAECESLRIRPGA